jgi:ParB family chromosome partitioning protein
MEFRDSLALIVAKDELPVSDVKRIARLFKDKDISVSTKGKLLYKTGAQLLETWSVYELNKAERTKSAQAKKAGKPDKSDLAETTTRKGTSLEAELRHFASTAPTVHFLPSEFEQMSKDEREQFASHVDVLIDLLEKRLAEWRKVKVQVVSP